MLELSITFAVSCNHDLLNINHGMEHNRNIIIYTHNEILTSAILPSSNRDIILAR